MFTTFRAAGFYDPEQASADSGLRCDDPSLTIQSQAADSDINTIVERFGLTGELPATRRVPFPDAIDVDEILDFRILMDRQRQASESFLSLPLSVRLRFQNDMLAFCDFAENPANLSQLREWGLAPPEAPVAPVVAPSPAPVTPPV